jgi:putative colanic acid biosynthesis glycosyltransferase
MKKILQINVVINTGSTGRITEAIGQKIIAHQWQSYIAYGRYGDLSTTSIPIKIGSSLDKYAHFLKTRLTDRHGFGSKRATMAFIKKIKEINPDIVHLHNIHGYYLHVKLLFEYLSEAGIPVVWTLHDCWSYTGHCSHYSFVGCEKWKTACSQCPQLHAYPSSYYDNSFKNYEDKKLIFNSLKNLTLVTVSNWLSHQVKQSFLGHHVMRTIKNGIDLNVFKYIPNASPENKHRFGDKIIILGVASPMSERKGFSHFVAFSKYLKADEILVLVGLNQQQLRKLPNFVIGLEKTKQVRDLVEIYSMATVFLNLTLEDNYPTTNLESIACGTPVITYSTGGSVESIDANTGYIVEKNDFSTIRKNIDLIRHKTKSHYLEPCRRKAISEFDKNTKFDEYINLYESILN